MRLIDADELIKSYLDHNRTEFEIKNCCMANENVIAIIVNAPTVIATEDCISREGAINALSHDRVCCNVCRKALETILPVELTERPQGDLNNAIKLIKAVCKDNNTCNTCPMNWNCNEPPSKWEDAKGGAV